MAISKRNCNGDLNCRKYNKPYVQNSNTNTQVSSVLNQMKYLKGPIDKLYPQLFDPVESDGPFGLQDFAGKLPINSTSLNPDKDIYIQTGDSKVNANGQIVSAKGLDKIESDSFKKHRGKTYGPWATFVRVDGGYVEQIVDSVYPTAVLFMYMANNQTSFLDPRGELSFVTESLSPNDVDDANLTVTIPSGAWESSSDVLTSGLTVPEYFCYASKYRFPVDEEGYQFDYLVTTFKDHWYIKFLYTGQMVPQTKVIFTVTTTGKNDKGETVNVVKKKEEFLQARRAEFQVAKLKKEEFGSVDPQLNGYGILVNAVFEK